MNESNHFAFAISKTISHLSNHQTILKTSNLLIDALNEGFYCEENNKLTTEEIYFLIKNSLAKKLFILTDKYFYFYKYFHLENFIAKQIILKSERELPFDPNKLKKSFNKLFCKKEFIMQKIAILQSIKYQFTVITGGPGTGKTFTAVNLLICLLNQNPNLNIFLVAPTGKANSRMKESIEKLINNSKQFKKIPFESFTIHRLLGIANNNFVKYHENNNLPCDVLIIDESSMIDIHLFYLILKAIKEDCRLILLGDFFQLPAIGIGSFFQNLCQNPNCFDKKNQNYINKFFNIQTQNEEKILGNNIILLTQNIRFHKKSKIGILTKLCKNQETKKFLDLLLNKDSSVQFIEMQNININFFIQEIQDYVNTLKTNNLELIFQKAFEKMFLSPFRNGIFGVENLNKIIDHNIGKGQKWYIGKIIIIRVNDYQKNLFNGDIGICILMNNQFQIVFKRNSKFIYFNISNLPHHETAFILTIHQSQGSQADKVYIFLNNYNKQTNNNLLYTAMTRAKKQIQIVSSIKILQQVINNNIQNRNSLSERIDYHYKNQHSNTSEQNLS